MKGNDVMMKKIELLNMKKVLEEKRITTPQNVILGLLNELELKVEDVEFEQETEKKTVCTNHGDYLILTYEESIEAAKESLRQLVDECGVRCFGLNLDYYFKEDVLEELLRDRCEFYVFGLDEEELNEELKTYGAEDEWELIEKISECEDVYSIWTEDELISLMEEMDGFDMEEMFDDLISMYGPAHELARYDGVEIEFDVDGTIYYAYRFN